MLLSPISVLKILASLGVLLFIVSLLIVSEIFQFSLVGYKFGPGFPVPLLLVVVDRDFCRYWQSSVTDYGFILWHDILARSGPESPTSTGHITHGKVICTSTCGDAMKNMVSHK